MSQADKIGKSDKPLVSKVSIPGDLERDSQKPWKSAKLPSLKEDWSKKTKKQSEKKIQSIIPKITQGIQSNIVLKSENDLSSIETLKSNLPEEHHDLIVMEQEMDVGRFHLSEKREIVTITVSDDPSFLKQIKKQTRKITDLCELDKGLAERKYDITEISYQGKIAKTDAVTNMCYEEIEGFHTDWNNFWCPEITEEEIRKEAVKSNAEEEIGKEAVKPNANSPGTSAQLKRAPQLEPAMLENPGSQSKSAPVSEPNIARLGSSKVVENRGTKATSDVEIKKSSLKHGSQSEEVESPIVSKITNCGRTTIGFLKEILKSALL